MNPPILVWRDVAYQDQKAISLFTCTDVSPRIEIGFHGVDQVCERAFEWQVQETIRSLRVPIKSKKWLVRVGLDAEGLAAVLVSQEIDRGSLYDLAFGGVAVRLHGKGVGRQMLQDTFEVIGSRCYELGAKGEARVVGMIHQDNAASQRMCSGAGMTCKGRTDGDDEYFDWEGRIPIPVVQDES